MTQPSTPTTQRAFWCPGDEQIVEPVPAYECSRCGERSDERRCEQCHIFASRTDEDVCPECFGEVEGREVVRDHDGTVILAVDYDPNGPSLNERTETQRAIDAEQRAAVAAARKAELEATSSQRLWADLAAGDVVLLPHLLDDTRYDEATVVDTFIAGSNANGVAPGTVVTVLEQHGVRVVGHGPDETVMVTASGQHSPEIDATDARYVSRTDVPGLWAAAGPRTIMVRTGRGDGLSLDGMPMVALTAVRGHMGSPLGAFHDAADARAFAHAARQAAQTLTDNAGRRPRDPDVSVVLESASHVSANLSRWAKFRSGADGDTTVVEIAISERRDRGSFTTTVCDRLAMLALADAAEQGATWLDEQYDPTR